MSCEVFCCEIFEVLHVLIGCDDKYLTMLFSFLDSEDSLDHYLAGYFEKVCELLFRRMTVPVMRYLNEGGTRVLQAFLKHMDNYSIMQIVQRLMLPHIPFSIASDGESLPDDPQNYQCNWSYSEETCILLCRLMLADGFVDVPSHISDLLITVLQLSPADALILSHLCQQNVVSSIIEAAIVDDADTPSPGEPPTSRQSTSLAAISVLDSMVLRLGESSGPFGEEERDATPEEAALMLQTRDSLDSFLAALKPFLPKMADQLKKYASGDSCGTIKVQTKVEYRRLGHRGLQLVKLVEALVRLTNPTLDIDLCASGVVRSATDLIFVFDLNSILHLSIQRIVLMIIEGGSARRPIQRHVLIESGLLQRVMDKIDLQIKTAEASSRPNCCIRAPSLGHLIHIVQGLHHCFQNENFDYALRQEDEEFAGRAASIRSPDDSSPDALGENVIRPESLEKASPRGEVLSSMLKEVGLLDQWLEFVQALVNHLDSQAAFAGEGDYENDSNQTELAMQALGIHRTQSDASTGTWAAKVSGTPTMH